MKKYLSLALFVSFFFVFFAIPPAYSWTPGEISEMKNLISGQTDLIKMIGKYYKKADSNAQTAQKKFDKLMVAGFETASQAFFSAKIKYKEAINNILKSQILIQQALNQNDEKLLQESADYLNDGVSSCSEGVSEFGAGLNLFNKTLKNVQKSYNSLQILL